MNTTTHVGAAMPENKWCPTCQQALPLQAFGPDRSRPPLFLQGRCRPCATSASSAARVRTAERAKSALANFESELAAINLELARITAAKAGVLHVPMRDGRRRPATYMPQERAAYNNWRALLPWPASRKAACVNKNASKPLLK